MTTYIIRRLLLIIPTLIIATIIIFFTIRLIPGDIVNQMVMEQASGGGYVTEGAKQEVVERIKKELGLDVPIYTQYLRWIGGVLRGDLGESLWKKTKVAEEIAPRIPVTLEVTILSMAVSLLVAFIAGISSAIRHDTIIDHIGRSFATLAMCVPGFWLGTMVMIFPAVWWGWSPPIKLIHFSADPIGNLQMFIIPSIINGLLAIGITMRFIRTTALDVLRQDYIRTAWSKGIRERTVIFRHVLKNSLIPVVTLLGLILRAMIGGTVIIETIFALPGLGRLVLESALNRDYPLIVGVMLFLAVIVLLINLLIDISYGWLDPRIRYK